MSQLKKVFSKLDSAKTSKNKLAILELMKKYKKINLEKSLIKGYKEMALVNLSLAKMCLDADNEALQQYEEKLTECE